MTITRKASLLAVALAGVSPIPALAQGVTPEQAQAVANELAEMRAQMAAMANRIAQLEGQVVQQEANVIAAQSAAQTAADAAAQSAALAAAPAAQSSGTQIAFKGAPQIKGEGGWSFKPRGRLQYDAGFTSAPDSVGANDGFGNETRRARLGVSGDMPGGFGYKFEVDIAGSDVSVTDAIISYETGNADLMVGQFNSFQSLEELTSSLHTSFIERAAFTDAFGFQRRVGAGAQVKAGDVLIQGGLFTDNMDNLSNQKWGADARVVFMPKIGEAQAHLGASVHYADLEAGETVRYRQRPLVHFTSERFINTGNIGADSTLSYGVEGAVISGPFHAVAEGHWQNVSRPGMLADPTFFGGYAEVGMFLTDDTRGYKGGKFDRTKPSSPVGEGGMGSVQLNLRYDRLDLNDGGIIGGTQDGYFVSLVWKPTDYTMLLANYGRLEYGDAALPTVAGDTSYGVDAFGVRAQIDF